MPALGHIYGEGWKGNGELCSPTIINPLNEHNQPRQVGRCQMNFAQCHEISCFFLDGVPKVEKQTFLRNHPLSTSIGLLLLMLHGVFQIKRSKEVLVIVMNFV